VEEMMNVRVRIGKSPIAGWGLFAAQEIRKGTEIGEYEGEIVKTEEGAARYKLKTDCVLKEHNLLFAISRRRSIDGGAGGNETRFINHSFKPNIEVRQEGNRLFFDTIKRIQKGQEIVLDYHCQCKDCNFHRAIRRAVLKVLKRR
jgi:SET domain-containing protein